MGVEADEERAAARQLARQAGADHEEITVTEADFWKRLPEIVAAVDDPVADYGLLPMWKLAQAAADKIAITISGEGADELFAGYSRYRSAVRPWWMGGRAMRHRGILDRIGVLRAAPAGWRDGIVGAESSAAAIEGRSALQVAQAVDVSDWLPNDLLIKLDRTISSHGLESRTPYLDPDLAAFAFSLPDNLKVRGRVGKFLLRRWASDHMGGVDAFRRKRGLSLPVGEWIGSHVGQLWPLIAAQPGIAEVCDAAKVESLFKAHGRGIGSAQWVLLFYALWHQVHMMDVAADGGVLETLAAKG
jgi:asparagine synthase (glutamine-hydrolysing)